MKSCHELLAEAREKLIVAKEQLLTEKKELCKLEEMCALEKDRWAKELKAKRVKIHMNQKKIKAKEIQLESMKREYEERRKKCDELENENESLRKEIHKANKRRQNDKQTFEIARLEGILSRIQERQRCMKDINSWMRESHETDARIQFQDAENELRTEMLHLSEGFSKQLESFDESLKNLEDCGLKPKQKMLWHTRDAVYELKMQCDELERKNKQLEEEIAYMGKH